MSAPFVSPADIEKLRAVAREKGVRVWIDYEARMVGKPFVLLQKRGQTLAEFTHDKAALQWLGVQG